MPLARSPPQVRSKVSENGPKTTGTTTHDGCLPCPAAVATCPCVKIAPPCPCAADVRFKRVAAHRRRQELRRRQNSTEAEQDIRIAFCKREKAWFTRDKKNKEKMCLESAAWAAVGASPAFCWQAYTPNYTQCWDVIKQENCLYSAVVLFGSNVTATRSWKHYEYGTKSLYLTVGSWKHAPVGCSVVQGLGVIWNKCWERNACKDTTSGRKAVYTPVTAKNKGYTPGYRTRGYASIGYTCVGDYCSAMNPVGTPATCAKFVSRANAVDVQTGKCTGTSGPAHRKDHMRTRDEFCMRYATLKHGLGDESANILSSNTTKPPSKIRKSRHNCMNHLQTFTTRSYTCKTQFTDAKHAHDRQYGCWRRHQEKKNRLYWRHKEARSRLKQRLLWGHHKDAIVTQRVIEAHRMGSTFRDMAEKHKKENEENRQEVKRDIDHLGNLTKTWKHCCSDAKSWGGGFFGTHWGKVPSCPASKTLPNNNDGVTPLYTAAEERRTEIVELLIKGGADANKANANYDGDTPLYAAAKHGFTEVVELLIKGGADANKENNHGATPLYAAAKHRFTEVVKLLIKGGADVNKENFKALPLYEYFMSLP